MRYWLVILVTIYCIPLLAIFQNGERLTFTVSYGVIKAAEATLSVEEVQFENKIPAYRFSSTAKTFPFFDPVFKVRDTVESIWDIQKKSSLRYTKNLREGTYKQYRIHQYKPDLNRTVYKRWRFKQEEFVSKEMTIPPNTQDILSAFYITRMQNLQIGRDFVINVTTDGKNYPAKVEVLRQETIDSIFGRKDCLVIRPAMRGEAIFKQTGEILIWITNDEQKVPLRMESKITFGKFTATLTDARNVPHSKK